MVQKENVKFAKYCADILNYTDAPGGLHTLKVVLSKLHSQKDKKNKQTFSPYKSN